MISFAELAIKRLDKLGFDQEEETIALSYDPDTNGRILWILTSTDSEINEWFDSISEKV